MSLQTSQHKSLKIVNFLQLLQFSFAYFSRIKTFDINYVNESLGQRDTDHHLMVIEANRLSFPWRNLYENCLFIHLEKFKFDLTG